MAKKKTRKGGDEPPTLEDKYFERPRDRADTRRAYRTKDIPKPLLKALLDSNADLLK